MNQEELFNKWYVIANKELQNIKDYIAKSEKQINDAMNDEKNTDLCQLLEEGLSIFKKKLEKDNKTFLNIVMNPYTKENIFLMNLDVKNH